MNLKSKLERYVGFWPWEINCRRDNLVKTQEQDKKIQRWQNILSVFAGNGLKV